MGNHESAFFVYRTAPSQLTGDIMQTNIEESDVPMVQVSEHWGARESHALWQG